MSGSIIEFFWRNEHSGLTFSKLQYQDFKESYEQ